VGLPAPLTAGKVAGGEQGRGPSGGAAETRAREAVLELASPVPQSLPKGVESSVEPTFGDGFEGHLCSTLLFIE
jgi:hypothetical protein